MKLTNQEIQQLYYGLQGMILDKEGNQRHLPLLPSVRAKRMRDDLEDLSESVQEAKESKNDIYQEYADDLQDKVDNEDSDYSEDDMESDLEDKEKELSDEVEDLLEQEVDVNFSDSLLTEKDIKRIDESGEDFPYVTTSAIELILDKIVE